MNDLSPAGTERSQRHIDLTLFELLATSRRTSLRVDPERPVPAEIVERLCRSAMWAPNHKKTWPIRFAVFTGDGRARLGSTIADALEADGFDRAWWKRGAELGWTSLLASEEHGGGSLSGAGLLDLIIVAEEFGRLVSPGPLVPTNVVAAAVTRSGSKAQQAEVLPGIISGDLGGKTSGTGGAGGSEPRAALSVTALLGLGRGELRSRPGRRLTRLNSSSRPSRPERRSMSGPREAAPACTSRASVPPPYRSTALSARPPIGTG